MLKIPEVKDETLNQISRGAEDKQKALQMMNAIMNEFIAEQPAIVRMIGAIATPISPMYAACVTWKAIKEECANSELQSWMDVK